MSSAFKTLSISDLAVIPYRALNYLEYTDCSFYDAGIQVFKGVNTAQSITGSFPEEGLYYSSIRNLFYRAAQSASFTSASAYNDSLQSTAVPGSYQADIRNLPTSSIKIVSVPQEIYGEAIHPKTFRLGSTTSAFLIVDDGNGNLVDVADCAVGTFNTNDYTDEILYNSDFLYRCIESGSLVGNILYPQGLIVITNPDYSCLFDSGPNTSDVFEVFLTTDDPKIIQPLITTTADCSAVDVASLQLQPIPGNLFPDYTVISGQVELDNADPLSSTEGVYSINYSVTSSACAPSNVSTIIVSIINCEIIGGTVTIQPSPTPTMTPPATLTPTPTVTLTPSITPTITATPPTTPSVTPTNTLTPSITPTNTVTPTNTPTPTVTKSQTPTPTPTVTPVNMLYMTLCLYYENTGANQSTVYYRLQTVGDIIGGYPPNTNVTVTFSAYLNTTSGFPVLLSNQSVTLQSGQYTGGTSATNLNYNLNGVNSIFSVSVSPANNGNQIFAVGAYCTNTNCTGC